MLKEHNDPQTMQSMLPLTLGTTPTWVRKPGCESHLHSPAESPVNGTLLYKMGK